MSVLISGNSIQHVEGIEQTTSSSFNNQAIDSSYSITHTFSSPDDSVIKFTNCKLSLVIQGGPMNGSNEIALKDLNVIVKDLELNVSKDYNVAEGETTKNGTTLIYKYWYRFTRTSYNTVKIQLIAEDVIGTGSIYQRILTTGTITYQDYQSSHEVHGDIRITGRIYVEEI